jgi:hypothetical protein
MKDHRVADQRLSLVPFRPLRWLEASPEKHSRILIFLVATASVFLGGCAGSSPGLQFNASETARPILHAISPPSARAGGTNFTLTVTGMNFTEQSVVRWNGKDRPTSVMNSTLLRAQISSGDIAAPGTYTVTVVGGGESNPMAFEVESGSEGGPLSIATSSLPEGTVGDMYSANLAANGGTPPYNWSVSSGQLPPGLALDSAAGLIAGLPSATGQYSFSLQVQDSASSPRSATKSFQITVNNPSTALRITTTALADGRLRTPYEASLSASGGVTPYAWSVFSGRLPDGLSLSPATGVISGTPSAKGTFSFGAKVQDSVGEAATASLEIAVIEASSVSSCQGIWMSAAELSNLPMWGPAWDRLKNQADSPAGTPNIRDQDDATDVNTLAKALVYARTGDERYRTEVINLVMAAIDTELGGRTLALGRNLVSYVIAAELVSLPADKDQDFRNWLRRTLTEELDGRTLQSTHELRPNNWGTHAGASRAAVARYLGDVAELDRSARVFKGYLGDRASYANFSFGDLDWQCDPATPVGINRKGCTKEGHSIDGVLPDDQRRSGGFTWPPPKENYVYEGLQGAIVQAIILRRAGYDTLNWENRALLRAYEWLRDEALFPAEGDDTWQLPLVDHFYGEFFWDGSTVRLGKNIGWTDWTHADRNGSANPCGVQ